MLKSLVETAAQMEPERIVLSRGGRAVGLGELVDRAASLATRLERNGVGHVVYPGLNGPDMPLGLFACIVAGIPFVPLNYRLGPEKLEHLVGRLSRPFVLTDARASIGDRPVIGIEDVWDEPPPAGLTGSPGGEVDGTAIATVLFTSGTTSEPKAVPLRHENLATYLLNSIDILGARPDEATLVSVPPYHVAAVGATLSNLLSGRRMVYLPNFDPEAWLTCVESEGITSAMVVPTMLARIITYLDGVPFRSATLRNLAYGGARISPPVLEEAVRLFPGVDFTNAYGLTETSSTIAILGPDDHRAALAPGATESQRARLGSVGRPIPGVEIEIRDEEGRPVEPGAAGELFVRGAQVSGEYVGQGVALDEDGWFRTHDGARVDEEGYLFVVGRLDDTIIRGAENISPSEIEDVLMGHPDVQDVAVVGVPDPEWGERTVAVIVPRTTVDPHDLREWVRQRLRSSRTPDDIVFVPSLPYGPTGKLLRREVLSDLTTGSAHSDKEN